MGLSLISAEAARLRIIRDKHPNILKRGVKATSYRVVHPPPVGADQGGSLEEQGWRLWVEGTCSPSHVGQATLTLGSSEKQGSAWVEMSRRI